MFTDSSQVPVGKQLCLMINGVWVATGMLSEHHQKDHTTGNYSIHTNLYHSTEYCPVILSLCPKECEKMELPIQITDNVDLGTACRLKYIVPWQLKDLKLLSDYRQIQCIGEMDREDRKRTHFEMTNDSQQPSTSPKSPSGGGSNMGPRDVHMTDLTPKRDVNSDDAKLKRQKSLQEEEYLDVMKYFSRPIGNDAKVICSNCKSEQKFELGSKETGNLWKHIGIHTKQGQDKWNQRTLENSFQSQNSKLPLSESKMITRLLLRIVVCQEKPFSLIFSDEVSELVQHFNLFILHHLIIS